MTYVDLPVFQADLTGFLERVAAGETVVIMRGQQPIAELQPVGGDHRQPRPFGRGEGLGVIHPNCFDPLPPDILAGFTKEAE